MDIKNFTNINQNTSIVDNITRFNGFNTNVYRDYFVEGNAFIFVTKPLLFIDNSKPYLKDYNRTMAYTNMTRDPLFAQYIVGEALNDMDNKIAKSLSYIEEYSSSSFLPIFTNECKSFDSNDTTMDSFEAYETKQGYRQVLPSHKTQSEAANTLSISVTEDSNLSFTKLMTLWVNYISNISDGTFDANPDMIQQGALDYMSSIYYFVLEPDGRTLKYWCKYTGCWPSTIPYSPLNYSKGSKEPVELNLQFNYTLKEDMNPKILEDFNIVSLKKTGTKRSELITANNYASIVSSPLLNRNVMLEYDGSLETLFSTDRRDPIILFKDNVTNSVNVDSMDKRFELIFDDYGYKSEFLESVIPETKTSYFINGEGYTSYLKDGEEPSWNSSKYWE